MSYYTDYVVEVVRTDPQTHDPLPISHALTKNEFVPQAVIDFFNQDHVKLTFDGINSFQGYAKWYDWEKELTELSKKYPDLMFIAEGDGEESDDNWICWFTAGLSQYERKYLACNDFDVRNLTPEPKTYTPE